MIKNYKILLTVGVLNFLHGAIHIFQFIQSMILAYYSYHHDDHHSWIENMMESPWMALLWAFLGAVTLYIGYKDYKHHRTCKD